MWAQPCTPTASSSESLYGRTAYRNAITQRLLPALRAFNPSLILMSTGFDAGFTDVGNTRTVGSSSQRGMDMSPADFEWVTSEIINIADICCNGRVVSVLEGGYGNYTAVTRQTRASCE